MATRKLKLKPLKEQVVVITGATSGIGLATARRAAKHGARVFLIARNEEALRTLCEQLHAEGARAAYAVADVADEAQLKAAADKCKRVFGGFDTWINNAGIAIFGAIRETMLEDQKRLFDTNYWGVVNGSLIAVEHLRSRPGGGALINIGSVLGDAPIPIQGSYSASKHAVKGFTNALRMELMRENAPIAVTLIKPSAIDTPYTRNARNLTDTAVRNPPPIYAAPVVAEAILHCAEHRTREITVGAGGRMTVALYSLVPGLAEPLYARVAPALMRERRDVRRPTDDALWDPNEAELIEEIDYPLVRRFSALAQARMHPRASLGGLVALALVGVAVGALAQRQRRRSALSVLESRLREVGDLRHRLAFEKPDLGKLRQRLNLDGRTLDHLQLHRVRPAARRAARFASDHRAEGLGLLGVALAAGAGGLLAWVAKQQGPKPWDNLDRFIPERLKGGGSGPDARI